MPDHGDPTTPPARPAAWLLAYCLTSLEHSRAWDLVTAAIKRGAEAHGGVHSVLLDGVADFVADVNDPGESNGFVAELHGIAIERDCSVVGIIHFNPGGNKTRGHLGSQLERKAETNLRLDKEADVTTIWSDRQRRAPIPKGSGPCFAWNSETGMHLAVEAREAVADQLKSESLHELANDIFSERVSMRYSDVISTVKTLLKVADRTAGRKASEMRKLGIVKKSVAGLWTKGS